MRSEKPMDETIAAMIRMPPIMARRVHREVVRPALEEVGVDFTPQHMGMLKFLEDVGEAHVSEIGDMLGIANAQMTKSVDKLAGLGMVERRPGTKDRRKINIRITGKGKDTLKRIDKIVESRMRSKLASLSNDELKRLSDSFNYIADTFTRIQ